MFLCLHVPGRFVGAAVGAGAVGAASDGTSAGEAAASEAVEDSEMGPALNSLPSRVGDAVAAPVDDEDVGRPRRVELELALELDAWLLPPPLPPLPPLLPVAVALELGAPPLLPLLPLLAAPNAEV